MFHPLSLFVGLRYVRARSHGFFVSFITWVSLLGVAVGVMVLIVILSVMNGLEGELRDRLLALSAHARVVAPVAGRTPDEADWERLAAAAATAPQLQAAAPYVELQALAVHVPDMLPVLLRGIDPLAERGVSNAAGALLGGRIEDLQPGSARVIVGSAIAQQLALAIGDRLTLLVPGVDADGTPNPRLREFEVAGVFQVGLQDHDGVLVMGALADIEALAGGDSRARGLRLRFTDALAAPAGAARLQGRLGADWEVRDWSQDNANYFRAIRIEKTMTALMLMLVVAVAAFSIVAMLVMVVTDKRTDIAILRTLGASPRAIMAVFATQGLVIGWLGVALGVAFGVVLALRIEAVVGFLERATGIRIFSPEVYAITGFPSELQWGNVAWIAGTALCLTALATVYPALRASRVAPAEALRYE
ncbi:MAG: lipoprotein-releasing ABC transporter permease subunit [Steroidobacteraceae bacterium]